MVARRELNSRDATKSSLARRGRVVITSMAQTRPQGEMTMTRVRSLKYAVGVSLSLMSSLATVQAVEISYLTHWSPEIVALLDTAAKDYAKTNPDVTVTVRAVPFGDLLTTLRSQASSRCSFPVIVVKSSSSASIRLMFAARVQFSEKLRARHSQMRSRWTRRTRWPLFRHRQHRPACNPRSCTSLPPGSRISRLWRCDGNLGRCRNSEASASRHVEGSGKKLGVTDIV